MFTSCWGLSARYCRLTALPFRHFSSEAKFFKVGFTIWVPSQKHEKRKKKQAVARGWASFYSLATRFFAFDEEVDRRILLDSTEILILSFFISLPSSLEKTFIS